MPEHLTVDLGDLDEIAVGVDPSTGLAVIVGTYPDGRFVVLGRVDDDRPTGD